jgi:C-terminal processing protease CtpA/Prc
VRPATFLIGVVLTVCGCNATEAIAPTTSTTVAAEPSTTTPAASTTASEGGTSMSKEAEEYLNEALDLMQLHSINATTVDWEAVREHAFRVAARADTPTQTHGAIISVLPMLEDDHSIFFSPSEAGNFSFGDAVFTEPEVSLLDEHTGYVQIGRYLGDIGDQADAYATDLAASIEAIQPGVCGWVVDLRLNTGGNMWPMIAGLSPVLGPGTVGFFTYPDGRTESWEVGSGVVYWNGEEMVSNSHDPNAAVLDSPVAVLIGSLTGSSGEATTTAFHGRPNTRLFGQSTAGLTTSNEPVALSDGAMIALTMSVFTDRNGHQFGQGISIEPDEPLGSTEDPLDAATTWLKNEFGC